MGAKSVTISGVDQDSFSSLKEYVKANNQTLSEWFNDVILSPDKADERIKELNQKIFKLESLVKAHEEGDGNTRAQMEEAKKNLSFEQFKVAQLTEQNEVLESKIKEFESEKTELENKELENKIAELENSLSEPKTDGILIEPTRFETALLNRVCEKESKRLNQTVTPATLLLTMFRNYTIKGEMWFFPIPKNSELKELKTIIEAETKS